MARILLDSTFLHDLVRDESAAVDKLDELIEERTPVAISAISVFEVGVGPRGDAEKYPETFHETLDEISISVWPAWSMGSRSDPARTPRSGQTDRRGRRADRGKGSFTRHDGPYPDVDEFERVDGLAVETY